jgi:hypothetical protein
VSLTSLFWSEGYSVLQVPKKEQLSKRGFVSEDVDIKGLVKRNRVVDQTIFDAMFLMEIIEQSHHEAAHLFLEDLIRSGATTSGFSMEPSSNSPAYAVANSIADRRMAFSSSFRRVVDDCGEDSASRMMVIYGMVYEYPKSKGALSSIAEELLGCLGSLSRFFGTGSSVDPRRVVRRQIGPWGGAERKKAP